IKQSKPLPEINPDEVPYDLPKGWEWCRWNHVALKIGDIDHKMPNEVTDGVPYVSPRDFFGKNEINFAQAKKISVQDFEALRLKIQPQKFDIIFPRYGTLGVNRFVLVDIDFLASYSCAVIKNIEGFIEPKYSYYYSISKLVRGEIERYTKKTTQANVGVQSIQIFLYPLPPLAEQRRIVAKIDELMARCDRLEKLRGDRDRKQIAVHNSTLNRLLIAKEQSEFNTAWQFITQHFSELYAVKENVTELRKAILQLAVMGKLVPQDPNDQPASELLREIEAEKQRLVKEGKIKQSKPLPEIKPDEILYELPKGWKWVRLGNISQIIGGFAYKSNSFQMEGTKQVLRLGNIRPDLLRLNENPVFINDSIGELTSEYCLLKNDILITMTGTRAKRDYLYTVCIEENPINGVSLYFNQRVGAIRLFFKPKYINLALKVEILKDVIFLSATGSANQANIGISNLREWVLPLPPLAEQHRIVAKIDQLMALCDNLEKQIDAANSKQTNLLNAVMTKI
ncbi:MAG TPA: restriction endonuclease subunit S, partial [Kamptonema sp.]|nr:restriction endonuclease subunit S [Kamptonema sp.]